ncbi:hypothetical protein IFM89_013251 [Coptis chinensis]|uniref:DC1 domain-containing protein n=1 Tax=Coptis chinensis TaxID=261450 RepID=A0A835M9N1_9MAGN|nr:hypothetical protein IFM89_013251 [Coptis chinensis]
MGKLEYDQSIQHFSHEHPLELVKIQELPQNYPSTCSGCNLSSSDWIYTCKACKYVLHIPCTQVPQVIHHPADPKHALNLTATPAYLQTLLAIHSHTSYLLSLLPICNACGEKVTGFRYNCTTCDLDFHVMCASMPLSLKHQSHPHPLSLTFNPPYPTNGFYCDICQRLGSKYWLYRCNACEFDVHLDCATSKPRISEIQHQVRVSRPQAPLQHSNSVPGSNQPQFNQPRNVSQQPNFYANIPSGSSTHGAKVENIGDIAERLSIANAANVAEMESIAKHAVQQNEVMLQQLQRTVQGISGGNHSGDNCADTTILENLFKHSFGL